MRQSVASAVGARACSPAIAACSTKGPGRPGRSASSSRSDASLIINGSHWSAILILEQHHRSVGTDSGRAARVVEQHQREQSERLRLSRHEVAHERDEMDRVVAQLGAHEIIAFGREVPLVEHEVQHLQHRVQSRGRQLARGGTR